MRIGTASYQSPREEDWSQLWFQKKKKSSKPLKKLAANYSSELRLQIASKCIASRIQKFLPRLIDNDQTGFLRNRFIGENIRLVDSVINYANIKQIPALLLFIEKTLNYYNFGSSLVAWIRFFYTDISSCVQNNGWTSKLFLFKPWSKTRMPTVSLSLYFVCQSIRKCRQKWYWDTRN